MNRGKVLISFDELKRLKACEKTLYFFHVDIELCPVCGMGMLCEGNLCPHCGYDYSPIEEWKQTHGDKN